MTTTLQQQHNLRSFLGSIFRRVEAAIGCPELEASQRELLKETLDLYVGRSELEPTGDPLAIFYFVAKAQGAEFTEQTELLGAFLLCYILAADLIDDVQDEDLAGKPHEEAGAAIATNNGFALLFVGLDALRQAVEIEPDRERALEYLRLFNRTSLLAVGGQHRDLMGASGTPTPEDVLTMQQAKTSSLSMVAECAALFSGCDQRTVSLYRAASGKMVQLVQVVDDLRDVFGKKFSPDVATNKMTYPLACFLRIGSPEQIARYESMVRELPDSIRKIRGLFYESGAIRESARTIEQLRSEFHDQIAATANASPAHRSWLQIVDTLASSIYVLPPMESTRFILQPDGEWHRRMRKMAEDFYANMEVFDPPNIPPLLPWHRPQWMYDLKRKVVFYPDLEGQPEEVTALQAELMGTDDLDHIRKTLEQQAPVVMVHELFHYWRDTSGNLTGDSWYEEWAANRLSMTYAREHHPDLLAEALALAEHIRKLHPEGVSERGRKILEGFFEPGYAPREDATGYGVPLREMALIQLAMAQRLCEEEVSLEETVSELLHETQAHSLDEEESAGSRQRVYGS